MSKTILCWICIAAGAIGALGGCSGDEIGRALYNTGKGYCKQNPATCSDGEVRPGG